MKKSFEEYMIMNGDDRLLIDVARETNKYGCRVVPYEHLSYSSSTASTIDFDTFNYVERYFTKNHHKFNNDAWIEKEYQKIRDSLRVYIGLEDNVDIALGGSGTDLELLPIVYANSSEKIVNIVVAPEEVGGGIKHIAQARHFSEHLVNGVNVNIGDLVKGFESYDIEYLPVTIRKDSGEFIGNQEIEDSLLKIIDQNYDSSKIILHMVYKSKTAIVSPRESFIKHISEQYPNILLVIDACQYRMSQVTVKKFINLGAMVLLTGSKFFGAPPFCAAMLVPPTLRNNFTIEREVPTGLSDYFSRHEFPTRWSTFNEVLTKMPNIGLLLRWNAAIYEMKNFALINQNRFIYTVKIFNQVFHEIEESMDYFEVESIPELDSLDDMERFFSLSLLTFTLKDESLTYDHARILYAQLLEVDNMPLEYKMSCHIGQPVKIKQNSNGEWRASLRIALNARFFSKYSGEISELQNRQFNQDLTIIFTKLQFLIQTLKNTL